jgi:hypothetical protein
MPIIFVVICCVNVVLHTKTPCTCSLCNSIEWIIWYLKNLFIVFKNSTSNLTLINDKQSRVTGHNQRMGFHPPITDGYVNIWDECRCCCRDNLPAPIWPTQYTTDRGCNLWSLRQWCDATSPISTKEPVMGSNRRAATHLGAATFAQELVMKLWETPPI